MITTERERVFIVVRNSRFDVTPAEEFGRVEYVFDDDSVSPFSQSVTDDIARRLRDANFDPERDYIALTGPTIMVSLLVGVAMSSWPSIRTLLFDARKEGYRERSFAAPTEVRP